MILGIVYEAVSAFIKYKHNKSLQKAMIDIRSQLNFQGYKLEYLAGAITLCSTYIGNRIDEIVDAINQLLKNISYQER